MSQSPYQQTAHDYSSRDYSKNYCCKWALKGVEISTVGSKIAPRSKAMYQRSIRAYGSMGTVEQAVRRQRASGAIERLVSKLDQATQV